MSIDLDTYPPGQRCTLLPFRLTVHVIRRVDNNPYSTRYVVDLNGRPVMARGVDLVRVDDRDRRVMTR